MTGKPHDTLDSRTVVPGAVKQNDFAARRKMIHIALEVPLRAFFFGWLVQRNHPTNSRIQALSDPFNDAAFSSRVPAFEKNTNALSSRFHPVLQLDQFQL